ncbi:unnamed protein product [Ectocarpus fasciculatus]
MNEELEAGDGRDQRRSSGSGSKRGRRDVEDFGRGDFAEEDYGYDEYGTTSSAADTPASAAAAAAAAAAKATATTTATAGSSSIGRAKHGKEAATGGGGGDGKAELIRQRNCENARKARARKKLEVHQLQEQVEKLKQLHARGKLEARKARELSTRMASTSTSNEVLRRQSLRTFMKFRCENVKNREKWAEIVDERFTMTLPITPYRWFNGRRVFNDSRVLRGIDDVMTDNGSLAVLVESLGCGTLPWRQEMEKGHGHGVKLVCEMDDNDVLTSHNTAMCSFVLRTTNAVKHGARREWRCRGMLSAKFIPGSAMLVAVEHVFDVTSLMQQLQKVVGEEKEMPVVPNTPRGACQPSNEARVIMTATPPYAVVCCNQSWTKLCGYSQEDIQGQTLKAIQGPRTDAGGLAALNREIERGQAASAVLLNYKSDGTEFLNYLRVYPLVGDGRGTVTHLLGVLQEQAGPGGPDPPQSEGKTPLGSRGRRQQRPERESSGAVVPGATTLAAADATAPTAAAAAAAKAGESSSATNPWRGRRSIDFGAPCTPDSAMMPPSSTSSSSGLPSTGGARRREEGGGGRSGAAGAGNGACVRSPVKREPGIEGGDLAEGGAASCFAGAGAVGDAGTTAWLADDRASLRREQLRWRRRLDDKTRIGQPRLEEEEEEEKPAVPLLSGATPRASLQPWMLERPQQWLLLQQQQQQQQRLLLQQLQPKQQQRQPKQPGDEEVEEGDKAEAAGCVEGFGEDVSTDEAFLDWADVLAGSPGPPALSDSALPEINVQGLDASVGGSGATAETAAGGLLSEPEPERPRSVSNSVVSIGSDGSWRPAPERTGLDLGALREGTPVDGGRPRPGDGPGARWGGSDHHRSLEQDTSADRGPRSVSDSAVCGAAPSAQRAFPVEGTSWDLLFSRCAERRSPPGKDTGGLSNADTRRVPAQGVLTAAGGSPGMCGLSRADGGGGVVGASTQQQQQQQPLPVDVDVDFSDLLLTPEELFRPPPAPSAAAAATAGGGGGGGGGASSSGSGSGNLLTMQTLGMFNPTLMSDVPWANYGVSGGCEVFRDPAAGAAPAAAAAATGGAGGRGGGGIGGMFHGGSWASATPSAGLAGLGQQPGGGDETAAVAPPPHHKNPGSVSGPKRGLSAAAASVAPTAMELSTEGSDLAGCQLGGAWPVQGDMLFSRTPLDAEADMGSTNRGLGDAWGCGADMPGGDLRNSSSHLSQPLRNFSSPPNGFG